MIVGNIPRYMQAGSSLILRDFIYQVSIPILKSMGKFPTR